MPLNGIIDIIPSIINGVVTSLINEGLKFYGDFPKINFVGNLGCGACIRGGYSYCVPTNIPGALPSTYPIGKNAQCCKDDACVANLYKDTSAKWTCSSRNYTDTNLALNMCPFDMKKCGSSKGTLSFESNMIGEK